MRGRWWLGAACSGVALACGGGNSGFDKDGGDDATADGSIDDTGADTPFGFGDTGKQGDGSACARGCSSDLHTVIDCNNNVVQQCTGTDGCDVATGTCINACQAAVDNKNSVGCEYYATHHGQRDGLVVLLRRVRREHVEHATRTSPSTSKGTSLPVASFARIPSGKGQNVTYAPYNGAAARRPSRDPLPRRRARQQRRRARSRRAESTIAMVTGTGIGDSFHITTDVPVVAYEMNPYGGGNVAVTGASLLLPVSAWDTNYVASTASPDTAGTPGVTIIAAQDNTQVSFLPTVALAGGGGIPSGGANTTVTFTLQQRPASADRAERRSRRARSSQTNKPVGVMAGNPCMNMPHGASYCDHGEQMLPPVRALGSEYVGVMYRPRHRRARDLARRRRGRRHAAHVLAGDRREQRLSAPRRRRIGQGADGRVRDGHAVRREEPRRASTRSCSSST